MANRITPDNNTPSIRFFVLRADSPDTITASEAGLSVGWRRSLEGIPLAASFTALSIANLGSVNAAHSAGGLIVVDAATGEHRLDLPSGAVVAGADAIDLQCSATDTDLVFVVPTIRVQEPALAAGAEMDIVDAPNATAVVAIQDGLSTFDAAIETVDVGEIEGTDATDYFTSMITAIVVAMQSAGTYLARLFGLVENTGVYDRFTDVALEQAPSGGGGGGGGGEVSSFSPTALAQLQGIAEFSPLVYIDQIKQEINLIANDDYLHADGRSLIFTLFVGENWPSDLDSLSAIEWAYKNEDGTVIAIVEGIVDQATGDNRSFHFDIAGTEIPNEGIFFWDCQFTDSGTNKWTPRHGVLRVIRDSVP